MSVEQREELKIIRENAILDKGKKQIKVSYPIINDFYKCKDDQWQAEKVAELGRPSPLKNTPKTRLK